MCSGKGGEHEYDEEEAENRRQLSLDFHKQALKSLEIEKQKFERIWTVCETKKHIGDVKLKMDGLAEAESNYKDCLKVLSEIKGAKTEKVHIEIALLHDRLAEVCSMPKNDNSKLEQSIFYLNRVLEIREANLEKQHSCYAASFYNSALAHTLKGEYKAALCNYIKGMAASALKTTGDDHKTIQRIRNAFGTLDMDN